MTSLPAWPRFSSRSRSSRLQKRSSELTAIGIGFFERCFCATAHGSITGKEAEHQDVQISEETSKGSAQTPKGQIGRSFLAETLESVAKLSVETVI